MGQLYILDLTKRGVDIDKAARGKGRDRISAHTVRTWNAIPGQDHPKDAKGRWTSGHPSVGLMGDLPDVVGRLSDDDLERADAHANSLIAALTAEKGRRGVAAMAAAQKAKPLKATKPKAAAKAIDPALTSKLEQIKKRPLPGDREFLEGALGKLTIAQIQSLDENPLPAGSKASKVEEMVRRLTRQLASEAVTHQGSARGRDYDVDYRRRLAVAAERGDRDEYAALVAGFGVGGTGPGLPPEKAADANHAARVQEIDTRSRAITNSLMGRIGHPERAELFAEQQRLDVERKQLIDGGAPEPKRRALTSAEEDTYMARRKDLEGQYFQTEDPARRREIQAQIDNLVTEREALRTKPSPAKPLKATKPAVKPNDGSALTSSWMDGTFAADIDAVIKNPKAGSAELLTDQLGRLKVAELSELAKKYDVKLLGRTKKEKIAGFVASTVQNKLNSQAIRDQTNFTPKPKAPTPAQLRKLEDRVARLSVALDVENRRRSKTSRIQSAKENKLRHELTAAKRERDEALKASGRDLAAEANERVREAATERQAGKANLERLAGGSLSDFGRKPDWSHLGTHLDTPARTSGDGQFYGNHYHGDGQMGMVIQEFSERQRRINVGGKRLDDALADVIIMGHGGEPGVSARQVQEWKRIAGEVEAIDPAAAARINEAVKVVSKPSTFPIDDFITASTPAPVVQLMRDIDSAAANHFDPDGEIKYLAELARQWDAGQLSRLRLINAIRQGAERRHESQEGFFEVRAAIARAVEALEAMGRDLVPPGRGQ